MQTSYSTNQNIAYKNQWHISLLTNKEIPSRSDPQQDTLMSSLFDYVNLMSGMNLSNKEKSEMQMAFKHRKVKRKQYLLQEGDTCKHLYFVISGALRMYSINERGHEAIVSFNTESDWCSDRESIGLKVASRFNIEAVEHSEVLQISTAQLEILSLQIPAISEMIKRQYKDYAINTQNRIHVAISMTAEQRYQNLLDFQPELARRFPKNMIACYLGIQPETLSRLRKR